MSYRNLDIYKISFDLFIKTHKTSFLLPKHELYELGSQLRRSADSVITNIVEGYGRSSYKKEHERFVEKIESFIRDYQANKLGLSIELMTFLKDWLTNHIMITDKKYTAVFNENGIV